MAKRPPKGRAITRAEASKLPDGLVNEAPVPYPVAGTSITALQIYHNPDRKPDGDGPWANEADKVAWVDAETGLGCIMLRQEDGTISGYTGVGPDHPLFGFNVDAIPTGIVSTVHGGLTYSKACEVNRFARVAWGEPREERYTVCHVTMLHRFSTDTIDGLPSVKLVGLHITNEIPVRSTLWTMSWPAADSYARDKFYLWLVERIDRWDHWSEMVSRKGARALSEHFMKLAFCDRDISARTTMPEQD